MQLKSILQRVFTGPLTLSLALAFVAIAVVSMIGGFAGFIGTGFLAKGITFLGAVVLAMLGLRLVRFIPGLSLSGDPVLERIRNDALASAVLRAGQTIGLMVMAAMIMGFAPSPSAWPGGQRAAAHSIEAGINSGSVAGDYFPAGIDLDRTRFAACAPYVDAAEDAVKTWWGAFPYPQAWLAQLYQESLCDPFAVSPVGAAGLAQFMPGTWVETRDRLGLALELTPHDDIAIEAGAYYMARQMAAWHAPRPQIERWRLALASYNAGLGNIIAAQRACGGARDWQNVASCLPEITGHHARETRTYVPRIERWWGEMAGDDPLSAPAEIRRQ